MNQLKNDKEIPVKVIQADFLSHSSTFLIWMNVLIIVSFGFLCITLYLLFYIWKNNWKNKKQNKGRINDAPDGSYDVINIYINEANEEFSAKYKPVLEQKYNEVQLGASKALVEEKVLQRKPTTELTEQLYRNKFSSLPSVSLNCERRSETKSSKKDTDYETICVREVTKSPISSSYLFQVEKIQRNSNESYLVQNLNEPVQEVLKNPQIEKVKSRKYLESVVRIASIDMDPASKPPSTSTSVSSTASTVTIKALDNQSEVIAVNSTLSFLTKNTMSAPIKLKSLNRSVESQITVATSNGESTTSYQTDPKSVKMKDSFLDLTSEITSSKNSNSQLDVLSQEDVPKRESELHLSSHKLVHSNATSTCDCSCFENESECSCCSVGSKSHIEESIIALEQPSLHSIAEETEVELLNKLNVQSSTEIIQSANVEHVPSLPSPSISTHTQTPQVEEEKNDFDEVLSNSLSSIVSTATVVSDKEPLYTIAEKTNSIVQVINVKDAEHYNVPQNVSVKSISASSVPVNPQTSIMANLDHRKYISQLAKLESSTTLLENEDAETLTGSSIASTTSLSTIKSEILSKQSGNQNFDILSTITEYDAESVNSEKSSKIQVNTNTSIQNIQKHKIRDLLLKRSPLKMSCIDGAEINHKEFTFDRDSSNETLYIQTGSLKSTSALAANEVNDANKLIKRDYTPAKSLSTKKENLKCVDLKRDSTCYLVTETHREAHRESDESF